MIRRLALASLALVLLGGVVAPPASAHGGPGGNSAVATNYLTRLLSVEPAVDGLTVRVIDAGSRIELTNATGEEVTVLGYGDEPYLRISADGVFENTRSPATYLNKDRFAQTALPPEADPLAEPEWRRVSTGNTVRWHDHRAHWMGGADPPAVSADRSVEHVVIEKWIIPITVGDVAVEVSGDLTWIPPPSPLPWYVAAAVAAVGIAVLGRTTRWRAGAIVAAGGLLLAAVVDSLDSWLTATDAVATRLSSLLTPVLVSTLAAAGVFSLRRTPRHGLGLMAVGGAGLGLLFGLSNISWLSRSQLPTTFSETVSRATVTTSLGLSIGIVGLTALRLPLLAPTGDEVRRESRRGLAAALAGPDRDRARRLAALGAAVIVAAIVALVVVARDDGAVTTTNADVHEQLCAALGAAAADDFVGARNGYASAIAQLDALAADVERVAPDVAADLAEARTVVVAALATDAATLRTSLAALMPVVRTALDDAGNPVPPPCVDEG
jgi:hypothetical protein